jgi:hypothetical protein
MPWEGGSAVDVIDVIPVRCVGEPRLSDRSRRRNPPRGRSLPLRKVARHVRLVRATARRAARTSVPLRHGGSHDSPQSFRAMPTLLSPSSRALKVLVAVPLGELRLRGRAEVLESSVVRAAAAVA